MENKPTGSVLQGFGLPPRLVPVAVAPGVWAVAGRILKHYADAAPAARAAEVAKGLADLGIPAARFCPTPQGGYTVAAGGGCFCMLEVLAGKAPAPLAGNAEDNGRLLGRCLGQLHTAMKILPLPAGLPLMDSMAEFGGWVSETFRERATPVPRVLTDACAGFVSLYRQLPRQMIHRDVHPGNLLFQEERWTGLLDLDLCQQNARLFDVCYLGGSLLGECLGDPAAEARWRACFRGILAGYDAFSPLTAAEKAAVPGMLLLIQLIFCAWIAGQDPPGSTAPALAQARWLHDNRESLVFQ